MAIPARGTATRIGDRPWHGRRLDRAMQIRARLARSLWLRERGVAELRWAAITLWTMVALGVVAVVLDPSGGDFDRVLLVATPAAGLATVAGWGPARSRFGRSRTVRLALGPAILGVAMLGAGLADLVTLSIPPAATLVVLAMAFAAMTPGYLIAAAILAGASMATLLAHWDAIGMAGIIDDVSDEFVVGAIVTLLASGGIAVIVRIATDAEARATLLAERERQRHDVLQRVNRIVGRFDGSRSIRVVLQSIVDDIAREFDIALVSLYLPDDRGRLSMVGVAGYHDPFHIIDMGVGIIGRAASTRTLQYVPDVLADPDYKAARADVRSEVAAPVIHEGELVGIVNFEGTTSHPIGPTQIALAEMICREIAGALRSARLDDERRDRLHAIERVLDVSRSLVADLDRPRIVSSIVDAARELLHADAAGLVSRRPDGTYHLEARSTARRAVPSAEDPAANALVQDCIATRVRVVGPLAGGARPTAGLALPIVVDDQVAAVLLLSRAGEGERFSDLDLGIADLLAAQVAIALQNADLHARVSESAVRDPLTGLLNRRYFDEAVETAFATACRAGTPLSLIVLDLDHFSDVNNEHGHAVGDAVLRRVARAMAATVRTSDVVARYGGEEFVVIAPDASQDDAVRLAERIRAAVTDTAQQVVDGIAVPLTISAGVASRLGDEPDGRALFRAADSALLTAKRAGRDRVVTV